MLSPRGFKQSDISSVPGSSTAIQNSATKMIQLKSLATARDQRMVLDTSSRLSR